MPTPAQKIRILEDSLRCSILGLFSLIPLLGAGFAIAALRVYGRAGRESAHGWNPARAYLCWGHALSLIALFSAQQALEL